MSFKIQKIWLEEISSTNDYANELISQKKASDGMLIASFFQSRGRGVGENTWESEAGLNLTFSVIFCPRFLSPGDQFVLNQCISLALAGFVIESTGETQDVKIKWPNDIFVGKMKMAGILINNIVQGNDFMYCIAGVGININQEKFISDAPNPVSLKMISGNNYDIDLCLNRIIEFIETEYNSLISEGKASINKRYISLLYRFNIWSDYRVEGRIFRGIITGISPYGQLLVRDMEGMEHAYDFKQIVFLHSY